MNIQEPPKHKTLTGIFSDLQLQKQKKTYVKKSARFQRNARSEKECNKTLMVHFFSSDDVPGTCNLGLKPWMRKTFPMAFPTCPKLLPNYPIFSDVWVADPNLSYCFPIAFYIFQVWRLMNRHLSNDTYRTTVVS